MAPIIIDEGYTLDYFIPAFFIGLPGLVIIYMSTVPLDSGEPYFEPDQVVIALPVAAMLLIVAVLLMLVKSGIEISIESKRMRVYKSIFKLKVGFWINLKTINKSVLRLTNQSHELMSRGGARTYTTKTWDLFLIDNSGKAIEFHNFTNRGLTIKTLSALKRHLGIEILDEVKRR